MNLNAGFDEFMEQGLTVLTENAQVNTDSRHITYAFPEVNLPDGITPESIDLHSNFFGAMGALTEAATAKINREQYALDSDALSYDGSLELGSGVIINSQHFLKKDVGDTTLYGQSTTTVDHSYSPSLDNYRTALEASSIEEATKLFDN